MGKFLNRAGFDPVLKLKATEEEFVFYKFALPVSGI